MKESEPPEKKFARLSKSLSHEQKLKQKIDRNISQLEIEISKIRKKLWYCPQCNQYHQIPPKKEIQERIETRTENNQEIFYKCKYVKCPTCEKWVLFSKLSQGNVD